MITIRYYYSIVMSLALMTAILNFSSCDNEDPEALPEVTTAAISDVGPVSATGGGTIISNGGSKIKHSGIVYSGTNDVPTINDNKIESGAKSGSFSVVITGLSEGVTYQVRAFAVNKTGIAYGEVVSFTTTTTTTNAPPMAVDAFIWSQAGVGAVLEAAWNYYDEESDEFAAASYQWYSTSDTLGTGETPIPGATNYTYTVQESDRGKYIRQEIIVHAATGTVNGTPVKTHFVGPVPTGEHITILEAELRGSQLLDAWRVYIPVTSSITGRRWLDRNLGAFRPAQSYDDYKAYGSLFQWGRLADGHQWIGWTSSTTATLSPSTTSLAFTNPPPNPVFIVANTFSGDWYGPHDDTFWNPPAYVNNPCPEGWRIPDMDEWKAEFPVSPSVTIDMALGFSRLGLTAAGLRLPQNPSGLLFTSTAGYYWASTPELEDHFSVFVRFPVVNDFPGVFFVSLEMRAAGMLCRCIENE
jgi:hypothetical protein